RHTRFSRDWSSDVCSSDLFRVKKLILDCSDAIEQVAHDRVVLSRPHTGRPQIYAGRYDDRIHVDAGGQLRVQVVDVIIDPSCVRSEERRVGKEWRDRWAEE